MREAANALIRVHKASTQNRKLRTKTSKISMSQRDNRKSCHSDQNTKYLTDPAKLAPKKLPKKPAVQNCGSLGSVLTGSNPVRRARFQALSEPLQHDPPARKCKSSGTSPNVLRMMASPNSPRLRSPLREKTTTPALD